MEPSISPIDPIVTSPLSDLTTFDPNPGSTKNAMCKTIIEKVLQSLTGCTNQDDQIILSLLKGGKESYLYKNLFY